MTEKGLYLVSTAVGHTFESSGQKGYFEGYEAGVYENTKAGYVSTRNLEVLVNDTHLTVRPELTCYEKAAGINTLHFKKHTDKALNLQA